MILIDARNLTHLIFMLSVVYQKKSQKEITVLWSGDAEVFKSFNKYLRIKNFIFLTNNNFSDSNLLFKFDLIKQVKDKIAGFRCNEFFTSYPHGLFFELLKKNLKLDNNDIFLFDDGTASLLQKKNLNRIQRSLIYAFHGVFFFDSSFRLFCNNKYKNIYSIFSIEKIPKCCLEDKNFLNISYYVNKTFKNLHDLILKESILPRSALLLSHHAVESKRMSEKKYRNMISRIVKHINYLGITNIYLSKHHSESEINNKFYEALGLNMLDFTCPAELYLLSSQIKIVAQPYNSLPIIADSLGILENVEYFLSFQIKNSPDIQLRKSLINRICAQNSIKNIHID